MFAVWAALMKYSCGRNFWTHKFSQTDPIFNYFLCQFFCHVWETDAESSRSEILKLISACRHFSSRPDTLQKRSVRHFVRCKKLEIKKFNLIASCLVYPLWYRYSQLFELLMYEKLKQLISLIYHIYRKKRTSQCKLQMKEWNC